MTLILKDEERERGRQGEIGKDIHICRDKERDRWTYRERKR